MMVQIVEVVQTGGAVVEVVPAVAVGDLGHVVARAGGQWKPFSITILLLTPPSFCLQDYK